jgi:hypothetical protein
VRWQCEFCLFRDQRYASVPADQQNVLSLVDVLAQHQFCDEDFVEGWLCFEVEGLQRFVCRSAEGGLLENTFHIFTVVLRAE